DGQRIFGPPVDSFLAHVPRDMGARKLPEGFQKANFDQILGMDTAARETRKSPEKLKGVPTLFFISEADAEADPKTNIRFAQSAGGQTVIFPKGMNVPHAMLHPAENPDRVSQGIVESRILEGLANNS